MEAQQAEAGPVGGPDPRPGEPEDGREDGVGAVELAEQDDVWVGGGVQEEGH